MDQSADEVSAADRAHSGGNVRRVRSREVEAAMGPSVVVMHRPALDRRRPIRVTPVQGTWTTLSALTGWSELYLAM